MNILGLMGMMTGIQSGPSYDQRKVGRTDTPFGFISTAMVVDGAKPFETAVADSRYADSERGSSEMVIVENYDTREEAETGHKKWVATMAAERAKLPFELVDCNNGFGGSLGLDIKYQLLPE